MLRGRKIHGLLFVGCLVLLMLAAAGCQVEMFDKVFSKKKVRQTVVTVPDVKGAQWTDAQKAIESAGLEFGGRAEDHSDAISAGTVIWSNPAAGEKVKKGSSVTVVVSTGPLPVGVPAVVGGSEADATAALDALGFQVSVNHQYSDSAGEGVVMSVAPSSGALCPKGSTVTILVSSGPAYTTCSTCGGSGTVTTYTTCEECGGTGVCYS